MKYLLLVQHSEEAFARMAETTRREMLAESVQLTHQLHATGQYVSASPLHRLPRRRGFKSVRKGRS
ncbi:MAG: hypothetical protein LZF60_380137 [Nitrospira sp.]|nr:MAG: hypothetical protein LZF60_380137 [Nitrospira sp.]